MVSVNEDATVQVAPGTTAEPQTGGRLRAHLIKGAVGSFVLQIGFAGFAFFNAIILARVLGAGGYGAFVNAMAWVSLLTIPATFGFGILLVRNTAIYRSQAKWGLLKGLLRFSDRTALVLSVVLALIAAVVAGWMFASPAQALMRHTLWIALLMLPLFALYNLREATTRGLEYVVRARLPGMIVRPGLLLIGIITLYYVWPSYLSAPAVMAVNVGAVVVALGLGVFFLKRLLPTDVKVARAEYTPRLWVRAAFPMLVYGGAQIVLGQTDIVMLGAMRGAEVVGLYAAANRLAYLLMYITVAMELIVAPIISRLYANGEKERLQHIIRKSVRIAFILVLPVGILLIVFGGNILTIFGREFMAADATLIILAAGRLVSLTMGSGGLLLAMTGHEKVLFIIFSVLAMMNILINAILIPEFGKEGAAFATSISQITVQVLLWLYAIRKMGINVSIFGILS